MQNFLKIMCKYFPIIFTIQNSNVKKNCILKSFVKNWKCCVNFKNTWKKRFNSTSYKQHLKQCQMWCSLDATHNNDHSMSIIDKNQFNFYSLINGNRNTYLKSLHSDGFQNDNDSDDRGQKSLKLLLLFAWIQNLRHAVYRMAARWLQRAKVLLTGSWEKLRILHRKHLGKWAFGIAGV